jgi:hypothetical protein
MVFKEKSYACKPQLLSFSSSREREGLICPGALTDRQGDAGPVRVGLAAETHQALGLFLPSHKCVWFALRSL